MKLDGPLSAKKILEKIRFSIAKRLFVFLIASFAILANHEVFADDWYGFPPGTYQNSCNRDGCTFNANQPGAPLACTNACFKSSEGVSAYTVLYISQCDASDITNCNGCLTCGSCDSKSLHKNKRSGTCY